MSAILDNTSSKTSNVGVATLSWSHTIGSLGNTGLIVVSAGAENTTGGVTISASSATFNGVSMTLVDSGLRNDAHSTCASMFVLQGTSVPIAGTYTITVTYTGNITDACGGAMSFRNVKNQTYEAKSTITQNGLTSVTTSITTLSKNALLVSAYSSQNTPNATSTTGDTRAFSAVPASAEQMETDAFYRTVATPASSSVTLSTSNPETEVLIIASFETLVPGGIIGSDI